MDQPVVIDDAALADEGINPEAISITQSIALFIADWCGTAPR